MFKQDHPSPLLSLTHDCIRARHGDVGGVHARKAKAHPAVSRPHAALQAKYDLRASVINLWAPEHGMLQQSLRRQRSMLVMRHR